MGTNEQMKALEDSLIPLIEARDRAVQGGGTNALTPRMFAADVIAVLPVETRCHTHGAFEYECPVCAADEARAIMREGSVEALAFHLFRESIMNIDDEDALRELWERAPRELQEFNRERARTLLAVATGEDDGG